jgi:hypothetical protein
MNTRYWKFLLFATLLALAVPLSAQQAASPQDAPRPAAAAPAGPKHQDTEVWEPVPPVVTPGTNNAAPPSDAIVLFDGKNLDEWVSAKDKSPAQWVVADGVLTVNKSVGNIETRRTFRNYQLHIEWRIPENITGSDQARGNSGVFLASTGPGDAAYELQVLDSYNNKTYVNGQAGSIYKQGIPLVNPNRKPGGVADLRRSVDGADIQCRRFAENTGLCHGIVQRCAGSESLRVEGRDAICWPAVVQEVRCGADQATGAWRS